MTSRYTWLEDFEAVDREVAATQAMPSVTESARLVDVRGAQALAWFEAGRLAEAADAAQAADADARRLGFEQHPFAVDYLRVLAGAALERWDLNTAEHLTERVLSISERFRPVFEFLAVLDRAGLAGGLPAARRGLVLARVALAVNDHHAALGHLDVRSLGDLTPRAARVRQVLLAAAAIERGDPAADGIVAGVIQTARHGGFLNTVVTTAPQVTRYLVEHSAQAQPEPFLERLIGAALKVRATQRTLHDPAGVSQRR